MWFLFPRHLWVYIPPLVLLPLSHMEFCQDTALQHTQLQSAPISHGVKVKINCLGSYRYWTPWALQAVQEVTHLHPKAKGIPISAAAAPQHQPDPAHWIKTKVYCRKSGKRICYMLHPQHHSNSWAESSLNKVTGENSTPKTEIIWI